MELKKFSFKEWLKDQLNWEFSPMEFDKLNAVLGDAGQGKTRLMNVLKFLKASHLGDLKIPNQQLKLEYQLTFLSEKDEIHYFVEIKPDQQGKVEFKERISKNKMLLFDRDTNFLLDEKSEKPIEKFYLPLNVAAVKSLTDDAFPTIQKILRFLERIVFFDNNRYLAKNLEITPKAILLNDIGSNLSSVIQNLREKNEEIFSNVSHEFEDCFPSINRGSLAVHKMQMPGAKIPADILTFQEKTISHPVPQFEWSECMLRALCLFLLPAQSLSATSLDPVKMICIDEIDCGLDTNTLSQILAYFEEVSAGIQVILTSHSPLVGAMLPSKTWRQIKRNGQTVHIQAVDGDPTEVDKERKIFLDQFFHIYRNYIAKTKLYRVQ